MNETLMLLSAQIEDRRKVIQEDLSSGNAKDYGGYQHACGEVRGLDIAEFMTKTPDSIRVRGWNKSKGIYTR